MIKPFTRTLDNGLRVVCVEMPHLHAAELAIYLKVGGRNDPTGREGLSHFLEHILFRGTDDFTSSLEIEKAFEEIGGMPNASTDAESTSFYSRVHPDFIKRGMEIFASMLTRPKLDGLEIEKRIITEEAREDFNEKGVEINTDTVASRLLWPNHPLGMPTIGSLESIASISRDDLQQHLQTYYVPANTVVVVAGPIQSDRAFEDATETFSHWCGNNPPQVHLAGKRHNSPQVKFVRDSDSQMALQIAFLALRRGDDRFMGLRLLRRLLAGGGSSRLHLRLREKLGIVYSVEGAIGAYDETGCFSIDLSTAPDTLNQAIDVTFEEILRVCNEPVPMDELERVKQAYIFDLEFSRDSAYEMGGRYGWGELMDVVRSIESDQEEARNITSAEILETARQVFKPENLRLVAVGPWKDGIKKRTRELVLDFKENYYKPDSASL